MWTYHDLPWICNPDCYEYNKEKIEAHSISMIEQYNLNKRYQK